MANDQTTPRWRNFAAWTLAGALFYILAVWGAVWLLHGDIVGTLLQSRKVAALLSLGLLLSAGIVGLSRWKRPANFRNLRNFAIGDAAGIVVCLLLLWSFGKLARAGALNAMGASEWVAAVTGSVLLACALFGIFAVTSAHAGADLIDEDAAEEMRERGRLYLCSWVWMGACGLLLIALGLAGPGGLLSPTAALAGALLLCAVLVMLTIAAWRLSDELGRTLSHETGTISFYLIAMLGGGWAILAHLGFVAAPAPLDWLTMFIILLFVAAFIAAGRRELLTR